MKVKTVTCLITLGPMTIVPKIVWAWEAEVLKEKFGGQCEPNKEGEKELSELPTAEGEFSRLQDAHGDDEKTGVSHVENTFGRGRAGLKELEKSIKGSVIKVKNKPGPKKKATAKKPEVVAQKPPVVKTESTGNMDNPGV